MAPSHIPLTQRKVLSGRLAYFDSFLESEIDINAAKAGSASEVFRSQYFHQLQLANDSDRSQREQEEKAGNGRGPLSPLDQSLQAAIQNMKQGLAFLGLAKNKVITKQLLPLLDSKTQAISCSTCASSNAICTGIKESHDDRIVASAGNCVAQLRQMFEVAYDVAVAYYSRYCSSFSQAQRPEVVFSTLFFPKKVDGYISTADGLAGGLTTFIHALRRAQVQLQLVVDQFDLRTYQGIPYLLFHECLSHAFHGIFPDPSQRGTAEPYDSFTEGWMDWVAYKILEEVVNGWGIAQNRWETRFTVPNPFKMATTLHDNRSDASHGEEGAGQIRLGVQVAELTQKFIQDLYKQQLLGSPDDAWGAFYRLSFDFNLLSGVDDKGRNAFINLMLQLKFCDASRRKQYARRALRTYLDNGDISQLAKKARLLFVKDSYTDSLFI